MFELGMIDKSRVLQLSGFTCIRFGETRPLTITLGFCNKTCPDQLFHHRRPRTVEPKERRSYIGRK